MKEKIRTPKEDTRTTIVKTIALAYLYKRYRQEAANTNKYKCKIS